MLEYMIDNSVVNVYVWAFKVGIYGDIKKKKKKKNDVTWLCLERSFGSFV